MNHGIDVSTSDVAPLIKKLFNFKKQVMYDTYPIWIRIPSESVVEDVKKRALLESASLRRKLRDPNSEEYLLYIDAMHDMSDEQLINAVVALNMRQIIRDYVNTHPKPALPKLSDFPTLEEQEQYEQALIEREERYNQDVQRYVAEWELNYRVRLKSYSRDRLLEEYRTARVSAVCEDVFSESFEALLLSRSIFVDEDCTIPLFEEGDIRDLPQSVKKFFVDAYRDIQLSAEDLKK